MKPPTNSQPVRRRLAIKPEQGQVPEAPRPTEAMLTLASEVFTYGIEMNLAKRNHDTARAKLLGLMTEAGIESFQHTPATASGRIVLDVEITEPEREVVDVARLEKNTTPEVFRQCISATKSAVDKFAGKAVTSACVVVTKGEKNVSVRKAK